MKKILKKTAKNALIWTMVGMMFLGGTGNQINAAQIMPAQEAENAPEEKETFTEENEAALSGTSETETAGTMETVETTGTEETEPEGTEEETEETTMPETSESESGIEETTEELATAEETAELYASSATVACQVHVQSYGWSKWARNGALAGTSGQAKRLEALRIRIENAGMTGDVEYRVHAQTYGWMDWKKNGATAGTQGEAKRLEAVQIRLTGQLAEKYDIYYRLHVQSFGWLGWAKNGEGAGTEGYAKRAEAIEIVLVPKGGAAPGSTEKAYIADLKVEYQTHVQNYGWMKVVSNGEASGTSGESKRLEAIKINLKNHGLIPGDITYKVHCQTYGWMTWKKNGEMAGTSGEAKRLEAIQIRLTGDMAKQYDIYYRVHCQTFGWTGWAKNGESSGSSGCGKRLEAIEIRLVKKGGAAPGSTENRFYTHVPSYRDVDWGIDVCADQKIINWSKVKADGVDFAMLRVTKKNTNKKSSATLVEDPYFDQNAQGALANGIPIGAYVYIYASTPEEARKEAELAVSIMKGYKITYPVAFDLEEPVHMTTAAKLNNMAMMKAFCDVISAAGYQTMVYGSASKILGDIFDKNQVVAQHDIWLARYWLLWDDTVIEFSDPEVRKMVYEKGYEGGNYTGFTRVTMWQFARHAHVNGIDDKNVDCNIGYKKY